MKEVNVREHTKRILVPFDFSEQSNKALNHAVKLAGVLDAEIVLLSVIEENSALSNVMGHALDYEKATAEVLKKQDDVFSEFLKLNVRMEPMVARGNVHSEIVRVNDMLSPELVVMGTNGKPKNLSKRFMGSNAYRVAREVQIPVITIHGESEVRPIKKIIFPFMLERKSKEKVGVCMHYARLFNAQVYVVALAANEKEEKDLTVHARQIQKYIAEHGVDCFTHMEHANGRSLPEALLAYNKEINGDLILIMEDESLVPFHLWTSELEKVMYNAEVPVMCVTPSPKKYGSGFTNF